MDMQSIQEYAPGSYRECVKYLSVIFLVDFVQIQRIQNEFTVNVYEIHARMALEAVLIHLI